MNEITDKVKETDDMVLLIEQHKRDIWEWKQKESQWIRDKNQLDGNKRIIEELSTRLVEMGKTIIDLKKRAQEAEGENTIIKGIGNNSPEMKELQAKVNELEGTLGSAQDINTNHQKYNGKLQTRLTEVEEDNKNLAKQIQDLTTSRKFGDGTH
jgi:DNA repair exonuclease SbcCD ATPase subunit